MEEKGTSVNCLPLIHRNTDSTGLGMSSVHVSVLHCRRIYGLANSCFVSQRRLHSRMKKFALCCTKFVHLLVGPTHYLVSEVTNNVA